MTTTIIEAKDLKKIFPANEIEIITLNKVSLSIQEGEYRAVIGPSLSDVENKLCSIS
ncbi:MAG: hypothetical protein R6U04_06815 [Bacteroidales bacterium]